MARLLFSFLTIVAFAFPVSADEVIIQENTSSAEVRLGDYTCSTYRMGSNHQFQLMSGAQNKRNVTAGELWAFFDQQGVESLDSLVVCLDVDQIDADKQIGLETFELVIQDPFGSDVQQKYSIGDNLLVLPGEETNSMRAECRLEVELGYDFMKRFSSSSKEKVELTVKMEDGSASAAPIFFVEGKRQIFTWPNFALLVAFCAFWALVFWVLRKFTLPSNLRAPKLATK